MRRLPKLFYASQMGLLVWLFFLGVLRPAASQAQNFIAQGEGTYRMFNPGNGQPRPDSRFALQVEVDGPRWRIEAYSLTRTNPATLHYINFSDGTNVTSAIVTLTNDVFKGMAETIDLGVKLLDGSGFSLVPWVGLCSSHFFQTNLESMPSIWTQPDAVRAFAEPLPIKLELQKEPYGLPLSLSVFNPGYNLYQNELGNLAKRVLPAPYDQGYRRFAFTVSATTNVVGMKLPLVMEGETFTSRSKGQSVNDLAQLNFTSVTITNYIFGKAAPSYIYPGAKRDVWDRRYLATEYALPSVQYSHSGSTFLSMDDPELLKKVKALARTQKKIKNTPPYRLTPEQKSSLPK